MIKKRLILFTIAIFLILFLFPLPIIKADNVQTTLNIIYINVPPVLINAIPNQTWAKNTNLTNAFNLDNYFYDNDTLTYLNSSVENISVIINATTHQVSFYPDYGFKGIRNITFTAFDISTNTNSNIVILNVTSDYQPPIGTNPTKDKIDSQIFQNTIVSFSANWQDNIALSSYIFSIKQESGWINQSPSSFSGIQNTSSYVMQISAPSGTNVEWKFYAFDTSGNLNSTEIKNLTVSVAPIPPPVTINNSSPPTTTTTPTIAQPKTAKRVSNYVIEPDKKKFKVDIKQGSSGTVTIKITNIGNTDLFFNITIKKLEKFKKILSEKSFNLTAGESKVVTIEFTADKRLMPDLYYGYIRIATRIRTKNIPIVIQVKAINTELGLNVNISKKYKNVRPGEIVKANITLTNFKEIDERNITFYYAITDFEGKIIDSAFEEFTFTNRSVILEKSFTLPQQINKGEYIFFARAVSKNDIVIDSKTFEVGEKFNVAGFIKTNFLILLIVLSSMIVAFMMVRSYKNKERLRLLNLYLMITELNKLIKAKKYDEAVNVYVKIKSAYGEPVSETALKNKEELKKEMEKLSQKLNVKVLQRLEEKVKGLKRNEVNETEKKNDENGKENETDKKSIEEKKENKNETETTKKKPQEEENKNDSEKLDEENQTKSTEVLEKKEEPEKTNKPKDTEKKLEEKDQIKDAKIINKNEDIVKKTEQLKKIDKPKDTEKKLGGKNEVKDVKILNKEKDITEKSEKKKELIEKVEQPKIQETESKK